MVSCPLCLPNFDVPTQAFVYKSVQNSSGPFLFLGVCVCVCVVVVGERGDNPDVILMNSPCNNMGAEYSQYGDECNFLLLLKPGVKNAPFPFKSSVKNP